MDTTESSPHLIIRNCPIEFVVVGPKGKRDGVLVRSEGLLTDLIGFAASRTEKSSFNQDHALRLWFGRARTMSSVDSFPLDRTGHQWDERKSEYRFCWVGPCSDGDREAIRETFNRYVADVQAGIEERDIDQVEWSLSPVILRCVAARARTQRRKRMILTLGVAYVMAIILGLIVLIGSLVPKLLH